MASAHALAMESVRCMSNVVGGAGCIIHGRINKLSAWLFPNRSYKLNSITKRFLHLQFAQKRVTGIGTTQMRLLAVLAIGTGEDVHAQRVMMRRPPQSAAKYSTPSVMRDAVGVLPTSWECLLLAKVE